MLALADTAFPFSLRTTRCGVIAVLKRPELRACVGEESSLLRKRRHFMDAHYTSPVGKMPGVIVGLLFSDWPVRILAGSRQAGRRIVFIDAVPCHTPH